MIAGSDAEARILALERAAVRLSARVGRLDAERVPGTEQQLAMLWSYQFQRRTTVNLYGQVEGCDGSALAGSSLRIVGRVTGNDYGTFSLPAGTFNFNLAIDPDDASASLDGYTTGPSSRWATGGGPVGVNANTTPALAHVAAVVGSGYNCFGGISTPKCAVPVATTLSLVDKFNTTTLTYPGSVGILGAGWANSGTTPKYELEANAHSFAVFNPGMSQVTSGSATWATTCPTDSGGKFNLLITLTAAVGPYVTGDTIHIFEP